MSDGSVAVVPKALAGLHPPAVNVLCSGGRRTLLLFCEMATAVFDERGDSRADREGIATGYDS